MKMNVFYVAAMSLLLCGSQTIAQNNAVHGEKHCPANTGERIKTKAERVTDRLMLDDQTAARFKPMYESYLKELQECRTECPRIRQDAANVNRLSDKELEKRFKEHLKNERKRLDIRENYYAKFSKILTQKQVMTVLYPKGHGHRHSHATVRRDDDHRLIQDFVNERREIREHHRMRFEADGKQGK